MHEQSAPQTIGKYRILGTLGRGAMGVVYRAQDPEIGRVVAIKVLRAPADADDADTQAALERFQSEARAAGNLRHPHIITVFEVSREGNAPFIVMDYIEGEGLDSLIRRSGRLEPAQIIHLLGQIAGGLDHAHSKGIVHRDVKPSNVLVDTNGNAYLLDFGVASLQGGASSADSAIVGSPGYMSPEQILNRELDARTDIFSLGVVVFEGLTGRRPFPGDTFSVVVSNILNEKPLPLTEVRRDLPLAAEAELESALAKRREDRPSSCAGFIDALARSLGVAKGAGFAVDDRVFSRPRARKQSEWQPLEGGVMSGSEPAAPPPAGGNFALTVKGEGGARGFERPRPESAAHSAVYDFPATQRHPGGIFSHSTDSLVDAADRQLAEEPLSARIAVVALGILCVLFGVGIVWGVFGSFSKGPAPDSEGAAVAIRPKELPVSAVIPAVPHDRPPEGKSLGEMTDREVLGVLVNLGGEDDKIIRALEEAKRRRVPEVNDAAVGLLQSDSYVVRIEAAKTLAQGGDRRVVPALVPSLEDHDPLVRVQVAKALMALGDRKAVSYLQTRLLREDVPEVKGAIKRAIEQLNGFPLS